MNKKKTFNKHQLFASRTLQKSPKLIAMHSPEMEYKIPTCHK